MSILLAFSFCLCFNYCLMFSRLSHTLFWFLVSCRIRVDLLLAYESLFNYAFKHHWIMFLITLWDHSVQVYLTFLIWNTKSGSAAFNGYASFYLIIRIVLEWCKQNTVPLKSIKMLPNFAVQICFISQLFLFVVAFNV